MIQTPEQLAADMALQIVAVEAKAKLARRVASEVGVADARTRVPVLTGETRDSITGDEDGFGAGTDYAPFIEFGTSDTAPQPFIGPAADKAEEVLALGVLEAGLF